MQQDWQERNGERVLVCQAYDIAVEEYTEAQEAAPNADANAFAALKTQYNIGTAYATAYRNDCEPQDDSYQRAIDAFARTLELYESGPKTSVSRDLAARASYQLGYLYRLRENYEPALATLEKIEQISAEPPDYSENWQRIRWRAMVQIGHIYLALARSAPKPWWQTWGGLRAEWRMALNAYNGVIEAQNSSVFSPRTARDNEDELIYVADAYYGKGAVHALRAEYTEAEEALQQSIWLVGQIGPDVRATLFALPWVSYEELGRMYAQQERWPEALVEFKSVIAADDGQRRIATAPLAAAHFGAAQIYQRQGDRAEAIASYRRVIELLGKTAPLAQQAQQALVQLDKE
jgi:tetratricopeptide (TPR) repeat protein